jgi:hypothetical protein
MLLEIKNQFSAGNITAIRGIGNLELVPEAESI